jgi:hypothetical protein
MRIERRPESGWSTRPARWKRRSGAHLFGLPLQYRYRFLFNAWFLQAYVIISTIYQESQNFYNQLTPSLWRRKKTLAVCVTGAMILNRYLYRLRCSNVGQFVHVFLVREQNSKAEILNLFFFISLCITFFVFSGKKVQKVPSKSKKISSG